MRPLRCAALLAAALATTPAAAAEQTRFEAVGLAIAADGGLREVAGLLARPDGWNPGDPAVLLLRDQREAHPAALIPALLDSGHAVLELPPEPEGRFASIAWLGAGLAWLRGPAGAGSVIVLGSGEAGEAALLAVEVEAGGTLGVGRLRFAGHVRLGARGPGFAPGLGWGDEAAWPLRVREFCQALVWALHVEPTPVQHAAARQADLAGVERDCLAALDPPMP